ncbi:MAG TPA: helix-turn-helix domain-containing protein [Thermomicrobiaceae bacterium]|nr:helix-turn-helix domain-containing protein [Thermomicrobiaceae bacterium]
MMSQSGAPSGDRYTLAAKIDHLFRAVHPRGRGEFSYEDVAEAIRKRGGPTISATYVWQLRKGIRDNPTKKHLEALADYFGVSPAYFFDDEAAARIDAELELLTALRDASVRQLALRAHGLSSESLATLIEMIERVRQLEGLPNSDSNDRSPTSDQSDEKDS